MLHNRNLSNDFREESGEKSALSDVLDIDALISAARRQWHVVVLCGAIASVLGLIFVFTATPYYTSTVNVLIDRNNSQVVEQMSTIGTVPDDETSILSQVELLQSDTIALAVVDKLNLTNDPDFNRSGFSLVATIRQTLRAIGSLFSSDGASDAQSTDAARLAAAAQLKANLNVSRVGKTYVLEIDYQSPSAELAAKIANAIGDAYLVDKLSSKYDATRRASDWLQDRIAELRQDSLNADLAVQKFRAAHGLVSVGDQLVTDQQLGELNTALLTAESDTAKARARLDRIQEIIASGQTDAIVTDVLGNSISTDLRKKYLDASKVEADISSRLGPDHVQAVRLRREMNEYKRLMFEELNRIAQSYRSDLDVATAREKSLRDSLAQATAVSASASENQVQLRELQRTSESYKNQYQLFLQRYQEAIQQQTFPVTEARVITQATVSIAPSYPRKPLFLALFGLAGVMVGCGLGAFREFRDRFFRTGDQVRDVLGVEFIGIAPAIDPTKSTMRGGPAAVGGAVVNYVVNNPLSAFAETMRSGKIAADMAFVGKQCKIIGVTSAIPGEGKSTISINFAKLLASQGARTILIDADLRNPGATRAMNVTAQGGLLEVLLNGEDPRSVMQHDPATQLSFLPAIIRHRVPHSSELLSSNAMANLLNVLGAEADYIVIDLPPAGPVVDARAIASRIDGFLFVVEWGKTARQVVRQVMTKEARLYDKCLGVVLNKVDQEKMKLYRMYGSSEYYSATYARYYKEGNEA